MLKTESDEDQTIELSDDEDEAKIVNVKYEDVKNHEERVVTKQNKISEQDREENQKD